MSATALLIPADTTAPMHRVEVGPESLEKLQALVGGLIEFAPLGDDPAELMVNEEGTIEGLPTNYPTQTLMRHPAHRRRREPHPEGRGGR